ncbi:MAG: hypothetical protein K6G50_12310 [bacterium]|nr:hypothetical protein [bacterium]
MSQFIIGVSSEEKARSRAHSFCARAEAARLLEKPFADFYRESGRDWVNAPCVLRFEAGSYEEIAVALEAEDLPLFFRESAPNHEDAVLSASAQSLDVSETNAKTESSPADKALDDPLLAGVGRAEAVRVICELTGYAPEDLRPGVDLRRDLGIDSLKMVQIIQAIFNGITDEQYENEPLHRIVPVAPQELAVNREAEAIALQAADILKCPAELVHVRNNAFGFEACCSLSPLEAAFFDKSGLFLRKGRSVREFTSFVRYLCGGPNALANLVGALIYKFFGKVTLETEIKPAQMLFVSNHQTALEGFIFPILASTISGLPIEGVTLIDHGVEWADSIIGFLYSHEDLPSELVAPAHPVMFGDAVALWGLIPEIESSLRRYGRSFHIDAEGQREVSARAKLQEFSSVWTELALRLDMPIVPVRFYGALPECGKEPCDFPLGFGQENVYFGKPIFPSSLRGMSLTGRREYILDILNGYPEALGEKTTLPDKRFAERMGEISRKFGCGIIPALIYACLENFGNDKAAADELSPACRAYLEAGLSEGNLIALTDNSDSRWIRQLADLTFRKS